MRNICVAVACLLSVLIASPCASAQTRSLAETYPAPQCAGEESPSGRFLPPILRVWDEPPINRAARAYLQLQPGSNFAPLSDAEAMRFRDTVAELMTARPDFVETFELRRSQILRPRFGTGCATAWNLHIAVLTQNRSWLPLAEQRIAEMSRALASDGNLTDMEQSSVVSATSTLRAAQGRAREARALARQAQGEAPMLVRVGAAAFGVGRMLDRQAIAEVGYDPAGSMRPADFVNGAYSSYAAMGCPRDAWQWRPIFRFNPSLARAFPHFATLLSVCDVGGSPFNYVQGETGEPLAAAALLEGFASRVGSIPGYDGWRQSAIYDHAAALAELGGDNVMARRLAIASQTVRGAFTGYDAVQDRSANYQLTTWRARLLGLRIAAQAGPITRSMVDEAIAVSEFLPRTTADSALRELGMRSSTTDVQARAALERYRIAEDSLGAAYAEIAQASSPETLARASAALDRTLAERAAAQESLRSRAPAIAADLSRTAPPRSAELQSVLHANEALLIVQALPGLSGVGIIVRNDRATMVTLPLSRGDIIERAARLRASTATNPTARGAQPFAANDAFELYRGLIAPFESQLTGVTRLIIAPDTATDDIPWGALLTSAPPNPRMDGAALAAAPWLVQRFAVSVVPSVTSFHALRRTASRAALTSYLGLGGATVTRTSSAGGTVTDAMLARLPSLPVDGLTILGAPFDERARVLTGNEATEAGFRAALSQNPSVIAFATHGLFAGEVSGLAEPLLVVTPGLAGTSQDDGLLTASEIAALRINANVVILLACNTASGSGEPDAEALSGLVRAFYVAGARNVIATYWVANDAASEATAAYIASEIRSADLPSILQRSAQELIRANANGETAHPYYWATFALFGAG